MKRLSLILMVAVFFTIQVDAQKSRAIIVTPPAPEFTDKERQDELAKRRQSVAAQMKANSVLVLQSAAPRNYAGDVDFMYRQENNHYYLTNLKQNGSSLVMTKTVAGVREYVFLPKRNPQFETWNGKMYSNEDAMRISGVRTIIDSAEFPKFLEALKTKKDFVATTGETISLTAGLVYMPLPFSDRDADGNAEFNRELEFSKQLAGSKIENVRFIIDELRLIKSPYEIKIMQHAIDITTEAQMRSMGMVGKASWEYEVQAEVEYTFRRRNADYWGYPSIVGCGPNATTLHYVESQGKIRKGDLLLMDVGAEYDHYTADVTRTFPVNGKFTKEQAEIYQIVFDAQEAVSRLTKPGASFQALGNAATDVIKDGLFKLGLITDKNSTQHRIYYMHGFGHWLGMNVHDTGNYSAPLKKGMIFTNEPGIYVREDALDYLPKTPEWDAFKAKVKPNFEKYKNIGVRIEDDLLVTETGVEWMTKRLPRTIRDVEMFMAKASKEMRLAEFQQVVNPTLAVVGTTSSHRLAERFSGSDYPSGSTVRRGWVQSGRDIVATAANHKH